MVMVQYDQITSYLTWMIYKLSLFCDGQIVKGMLAVAIMTTADYGELCSCPLLNNRKATRN